MADRIAWTATLKRDAEKNNNSSFYEADETDDTDGYATLVRTRYADTPDAKKTSKNACCPACSPRLTYAASYGLAMFAFLGAINVKLMPDLSLVIPPWSDYNAKSDCQGNSTACWQTILMGNLLRDDYQLKQLPEVVIALMVLWGFHFLRRFGEVLFMHDYRRKVWKTECLLLPLYHLFFGVWIGWACNYHLGYVTPFYPILCSGAVLFVVGEVGNCAAHVKLYQLRNKPYSQTAMELTPSQHVLPKGFLFQVICCPHYLFDIVTWVGFAIATCTLSSYIFAAFTLVILSVKGRMRYSAYCKEFHGRGKVPRYNKSRKAMIPYIL